MTKFAPMLIGTLLIVGMTGFSVYQTSTIKEQSKLIRDQSSEMNYLEESLENEMEENETLVSDNTILRDKIVILRDSIFDLKSQVVTLKKKVRKQDKTIKSIRSKMRDLESQYTALKSQIVEQTRQDEADRSLLAQLEAEKTALRRQIADLSLEKDQEVLARQETEAELLDRQVNEARFKRITNIVNNTKVKFEAISARTKRFGRSINRIKKKNSKWRYTVIQFSLEHPDLNLLLDEKFVVKVVNQDTHEVLSYIESNPNFPESSIDSKGVEFKYNGQMVEISYYNNGDKKGKNYEVQIFFVSDAGEEYLLLEGAKNFITNRKAL